MTDLLKAHTVRGQMFLVFLLVLLLHMIIPTVICLGDIHVGLFSLLTLSFLCCLCPFFLVLLLVNKMLIRLEDLTSCALAFGRNPDKQYRPLPEKGSTEVRRAALAFNSMQKQIQTLLHERDDMFIAIAHDIRTPLARIQMATEMLEDERLKKKILNNIAELSSIIEKGMALTKSGLSAEPQQMLDLVSFTENLVEEVAGCSPQVRFRDRTVDMGRICVRARSSGLEMCLRNLISNAINYGKDDVTVCVSATEEEAVVDVVDNGPGIPDCCMDRVMQPFFRLENSRNKSFGGLGLGLPIALNSAKLDGGELHLSNLKEGGVRARLILPRHPAPRTFSADANAM